MTPPRVLINEPSNNSFISGTAEFNSTIVDVSPVTVSMFMDGAALPDGTTSLDTTSLADGMHTITVLAIDAAKNRAEESNIIIVDNTPPSVSILEPLNNEAIRQIREILADVYDQYLDGVTLFINDEAVSNSDRHTFNTSAYPDGTYTITAEAVDLAKNTGSDNITVIVDNTQPDLYVSELNVYPTINNPVYSLFIMAEENAIVIVNNEPLILDNGTAVYSTSISLGANYFIVKAIDRAGNPSVWEKTRLVDEDNLPDLYELNVTGTDPLNNDSDSSFTIPKEATNGIPDDNEDFDGDGLTNLQEFRLDTNPFSMDSDNDGLIDKFEVFSLGTYPNSNDSDHNGIGDAEEDFDADNLTNLQEQELGTNPLIPDTDNDTLTDDQEILIGTNPLSKDTDNDGLEDNSELNFGTDPLVADSDVDGVVDGDESYIQTYFNDTAGVEVTLDAVGDAGKTIYISNVKDTYVLLSEIPDVLKTIEISTDSEVNFANIKIYYNSTQVIDPLALKMFYFNDSDNTIQLLETQGINTEENFVWGNTTHLSVFFISPSFLGDWWGFDQWYVDWKHQEEIKPGTKIRINANIHNLGNGTAENIEVKYYADDVFIGSTNILAIPAENSSLAYITWTVKREVNAICVKVDPDNLIAELNDENNDACIDFSKYLDSDRDGLTDSEERNGMRVAWPYAKVTTDPNNWDTDTDHISDGDEMGDVILDAENKRLYDYQLALSGTESWIFYDGYHYQYISNPNKKDSDWDLLNDYDEKTAGTNPLKMEPFYLVESISGYIFGDITSDIPKHDNLAYVGGAIASGATPLIEWAADVRDILALSWRGEYGFAGLIFFTGIISSHPATIVGDEIPEAAARLLRHLADHPEDVIRVAREIAEKFPRSSIRLLDEIYDGAVTALKESYGLSDETIIKYAKEDINLKQLLDDLDGPEGLAKEHTTLSKNTAGEIITFNEPLRGEIKIAGKGVQGTDIVVITKDGRTIGREVTTLEPTEIPKSVDDFTNKLKYKIEQKNKQIVSDNSKNPKDINELHIQIDKGSEFANKDSLIASIDRAKGNLGDSYLFDKIVLYDKAGNILATW